TYDKWGRIWLGHYGLGIYMLDEDDEGTVRLYNFDQSNGLIDPYIDDIFGDDQGNLWIGSRVRGLSRIALDSITPAGMIYHYREEYGFPADVVNSIIQREDGSVWCAIYEHDTIPKAGFARLYEDSLTFFGKEHGLIEDDLLDIDFDSKGRAWISSVAGHAYCYDFNASHNIKQVNIFEKDFKFLDNWPRTLAVDKNDAVWMGFSYADHITRISQKEDGQFLMEKIDESDGMPGKQINTLFNDKQNRFWIGSVNGMILVKDEHPDEIKYQPFSKSNGLPSQGFYPNGLNENAEGQFLAVGGNLIYQFNPAEISDERLEPVSIIKDVLLFDEQMSWEQGAKLMSNGVEVSNFEFDSVSLWTNLPQNLNLKYDNNFITFECVGIDLQKSDLLEYSYKLNENDFWSKASNDSKIVIGKLPPATYNFNVRSRFKNGAWGPSASFPFTIRPPWWRSWLAYIAYTLSLAAIVFAIIRIRIKIAMNRAKALEQIRTKISTDLH
ncbi:MAG: two-component regulator propeller domain-containing protein, partial [Bacteroidota bacterium]